MKPADVVLYPPRDDLLACAARHIIARANTLPDLTGCTVLLPDLLFAARLRRELLDATGPDGPAALLGPDISTPELWLAERSIAGQAVPGRARRELILVEAIEQHRSLFGDQNPWSFADSLLTLFHELTLQRVPVDESPAAFQQRLQSAYGLAGKTPLPFDREARIVQTLWQAWHQQLQASDLQDPAAVQLARFAALQARPAETFIYLVGIDAPNAAEAAWIESVLAAGSGQFLAHQPLPGTVTPAHLEPILARAVSADRTVDTAADVLDSMLGPIDVALSDRARQACAVSPQSPLLGQLSVFTATSPEQEARAIELQVRRWLLAGHSPVAIVTEDRRLGRRVRALLERAGIQLNDPGGWALSTTRAAAALERWLQTVEEDFAHEPLLDTLKSPFTLPQTDREKLEHAIFRFETDIVRREQVANGLQRYHRQIDARQARVSQPWSRETTAHLHQLLDDIGEAAAPLLHCLQGRHAPADLLQRLQASLAALGIWQAFSDDPAGMRILHEWQLLLDAAAGSTIGMDWSTFRAWLGNALEQHDFRPPPSSSPVWLLNLEQARLGRFAGIVVGACDNEHLPATPAGTPFFNDRVRAALGLPTREERHAVHLSRFRILLESAPRILLSWHREHNGEQRTPAAWLSRIGLFHRLAWTGTLEDTELGALLDHPGTRVAGRHPLPMPGATVQPRVTLAAGQLPQKISVSAHGMLVDCPYRFFAAATLRLRAREEVRRELEKSEYGSLVHRALEIFHGGAAGYPEPLQHPVSLAQRDAAVAQLDAVSRCVFTSALEDNFEHRAWLRRWLALTGDYIDWLIRHQARWQFAAGERSGERGLDGGYLLTGQVDRIDRDCDRTLILDYKTGRAPDQAAVASGEAVQLPSYALCQQQPPAGVGYVLIDSKLRPPVRDGSRLEGDELQELSNAVRVRLETVLAEIDAGVPLPAWGDTETCRYCEADGLCRRAAWPGT